MVRRSAIELAPGQCYQGTIKPVRARSGNDSFVVQLRNLTSWTDSRRQPRVMSLRLPTHYDLTRLGWGWGGGGGGTREGVEGLGGGGGGTFA